MPKLILVRHGESQWNLENRFTGWVDVELTPRGEAEARTAGEHLKDLPVDKVYTSVLKRAINTSKIALEAAGKPDTLPTERDQALNERHYGDLQGLNKAETAEQYGDAQVKIWRRSYDVPRPAKKASRSKTPPPGRCPTSRRTSCPTSKPASTSSSSPTAIPCAPSSWI